MQSGYVSYRQLLRAMTSTGIMLLGFIWGPLHAEPSPTPEQSKHQTNLVQSGLADAVWPKSRGDLGNTGRSVGKGAVGKLRWKEKIHFGSDPIIDANGLVYVGSDDNTIFVLDAATGVIRSRVSPVLVSPSRGDGFSTPALGKDSTIYAGSTNLFYAFDGQSGAVKWKFPAGFALFRGATLGADGTVYVGAFDWEVYALDGETGRKKWGYRTDDHIMGTPALGSDGTIYVTSKDGNLYALNGKTGKRKWKFAASNVIYSSPALAEDGTLYFASKDARIYAINSHTGKQKWTFKADGGILSSPAIGRDQTIYIGGKYLYALDGKTGRKKWAFQAGSFIDSSPSIDADGTVYFGCYDHNLYAVNGKTGKLKWAFKTGGSISTSPSIGSDGTIYFTTDNGYLYAIY